MTETNRIECKTELTKDLDLEKEVIASLDFREGGVIYIHIHIGIDGIDSDMLKSKPY